MLRAIKIALIASVALWGYVGALGNILDWGGTIGGVFAAATMSTWEGGADSWRATDNSILITLAAVLIVAFKLTSAILCSLGAIAMVRAYGKNDAFDDSKRLALAGCGVAILLLFGGWILFAETWFEMWRSEPLRDLSLGSAFRYLGSIAVIALFVALKDDERST